MAEYRIAFIIGVILVIVGIAVLEDGLGVALRKNWR